MTHPRIVRTDDNGTSTLLLNRPEKLNALDTRAFVELNRHLDDLSDLADRGAVRCVVLRGAGRAFCAGADLATAASAPAEVKLYKSQVLRRLELLPVPVIAAVHGHCIGGGLELALAADIFVADHSAQFADRHAQLGLVPAWGMTQRLPRRVGPATARYLLLTGRAVDAGEALRLGLVDVVTGDLDAEVHALAADLDVGPADPDARSRARGLIKALVADGADLPLDAALAREHARVVRPPDPIVEEHL